MVPELTEWQCTWEAEFIQHLFLIYKNWMLLMVRLGGKRTKPRINHRFLLEQSDRRLCYFLSWRRGGAVGLGTCLGIVKSPSLDA